MCQICSSKMKAGQWPAVGGQVEAGAGLEVVMNEAMTR